jgi:hypothetical protein
MYTVARAGRMRPCPGRSRGLPESRWLRYKPAGLRHGVPATHAREEIPVPIKGSVSAGKCQLNYGEASFGTNRGLAVAIEGQEKSNLTFMIKPNPHNEDSKYYNKNQAEFYKLAATAVVKKASEKNGKWVLPATVKIDVNGHDYTLEPR